MSYIGSEATYIHHTPAGDDFFFADRLRRLKMYFSIPSCHGEGVFMNGRCQEKGGALGQIQRPRASKRRILGASASVGATGPYDRAKACF